MERGLIHSLSRLLPACLLLSAFGCAAPRSGPYGSLLPEQRLPPLRTISVLPSRETPKSNFATFAKGRPTGVGQGAAAGAAEGALGMSIAALEAGPLGVLLMPFMAVAGAAVGAAAGGVAGAVHSVPASKVEEIESTIEQAAGALKTQEDLARSFVSAGGRLTGYGFRLAPEGEPGEARGDASAAAPPSELTIEPSLRVLGFVGGRGRDPAVSLTLSAWVSVRETTGGREVYSGPSSYLSPARRFSDWSRDGAALLRQELGTGYARVAEQTIEHLFLVHDLHLDSAWAPVYHCALRPYDPPLTAVGFFTHERRFAKVASLQPTLTWEAFPREKDREWDRDGVTSRLKDVTYDVRIWKCGKANEKELTLVYDARGVQAAARFLKEVDPVPQPSGNGPEVPAIRVVDHTVRTELEPRSEYYWSVRARFELDGKPRVTRWSYSRIPWYAVAGAPDPCLADHIPLTHYHRFKTP